MFALEEPLDEVRALPLADVAREYVSSERLSAVLSDWMMDSVVLAVFLRGVVVVLRVLVRLERFDAFVPG